MSTAFNPHNTFTFLKVFAFCTINHRERTHLDSCKILESYSGPFLYQKSTGIYYLIYLMICLQGNIILSNVIYRPGWETDTTHHRGQFHGNAYCGIMRLLQQTCTLEGSISVKSGVSWAMKFNPDCA